MLNNNRNPAQDRQDGLQNLIDAVRAEEPKAEDYHAARRRLMRRLETHPKENPIMIVIRKVLYARIRLAAVSTIALALIALVIMLQVSGPSPNQAYAAVAQQLRNATTISFLADWYFDKNEPPTRIEMAYREPGLQRIVMTLNEARMVQVLDTARNAGIVLMPEARGYLPMDLPNLPQVERERLSLIQLVTEGLKSLPLQADEVLDSRMVDGRRARGFHAGDQTIWIDVRGREILRVETNLGATRMILTQFRIDPSDLTEADFSVEPPEGYTPVLQSPLAYDTLNPTERDVIEYLCAVAKMTTDKRFPATLNPMEVMNLEKEGRLDQSKTVSPEEEEKAGQEFARAAQKTVMFVAGMKAYHDWNYQGKDVVLGDAKTPIAWWKPNDEGVYRVIWGDLSVTEVPAGELPGIVGR